MSQEADGGQSVAQTSGNEFVGDLGLPTGVDTSDLDPVSPESTDSPVEADSSDGAVDGSEGVQDQAQEGEATVESAAPPEKFTFLGKEYDSKEAFEQNYRTLEGRVRAQGQELARVNNLVDQWERWYDYDQNVLKAAQPKPDAEGDAKKAAREPFLEAIDWNAVERLNQEKGFKVAAQALVIGLQDHIQNEVLKGLKDEISQATEPIRVQKEAEQADNYVKNWFYEAAMTVDADGNPIFPDLYDQGESFNKETATEIVNAWASLVKSHPQFGLTRDGIEYAIERGKRAIESRGQAKQKATSNAQAVVRDAQGRFVKQSEAALSAEEGTGVDTSDVTGEKVKISEEEEIRRGIKNAGKVNDKASFFGIA